MAPTRLCGYCNRPFTPKSGRAVYCGPTCRADAHYKRKSGSVVALPEQPTGGLTASVTAELEHAERLSTPLGQVALAIAARIDAGAESGAAVAALSRELRALRSEVLADVAPKGSKVETMRDELAERRHA